MQNGRHGGLSGKERVYRLRERAARERADEWMSEYFEPDETAVLTARPVPVNRRAAFLSTVSDGGGTDMNESPQLQLALRSVSLVDVPAPADLRGGTKADATERPRTGVTRAPAAAAKVAFKPHSARNRPERFSLAGFAWGCALGGAAAAVLLLVMYAIGG